jgi:hypothetical protein
VPVSRVDIADVHPIPVRIGGVKLIMRFEGKWQKLETAMRGLNWQRGD